MLGFIMAGVGGAAAGMVLGPKVKAKLGETRVGKMLKMGGGCGCAGGGGRGGGCSCAEGPPAPIAPLGPPRVTMQAQPLTMQGQQPLTMQGQQPLTMQGQQPLTMQGALPVQFQAPVGVEFGAGSETVEWCGVGGGCRGKTPKWQ